MKERPVFEQAVEALGRMSPTQLANIVRKAGLKGRPHTSYQCPMAKLLDIQCGSNPKSLRIGVGKKFIIKRHSTGSYERIPTPKSVTKFLVDFDLGKYPDLFAPPPRSLRPDPRKGDRHRAGYIHPIRRKKAVRRNLVHLLGGRGQYVEQ